MGSGTPHPVPSPAPRKSTSRKLLDRENKKKYELLLPDYVEDRQALLLCKRVLEFVARKHYWPTVKELSEYFIKGRNYTHSACVYYSRVAIDKGYLEHDKWNHLRPTPKYYDDTHTEPVEPQLPSHPRSRARVIKFNRERALLLKGNK
jgi:hypothetical protein